MDTREVVIDGSTLEKRRDQRAEQLERFIGEMTPENRQGFIGKVNQWTKAAGVQVVDASESVFDLNSPEKKLRDYSEVHAFDESELPTIIKRTPEQRLNSMVQRLKAASPQTVEPVLKDIAGEYWKAGAPVTVDALRAVASHFLNRTERK